jgi:hypothetical protein
MIVSDRLQPILFRVTVDSTGLGGAAPADGFIDSTATQEYMAVRTLVGTAEPAMNNQDKIVINDTTIAFENGSLDIDGVVDTINAFTQIHHVIASKTINDYLQLTNEPEFEGQIFNVFADDAVLVRLGWDTFTQIAAPIYPADIDASLSKARGNMRWEAIIQKMSERAVPRAVTSIRKPGATIDTQATEFSFTVSYMNIGHLYTIDENTQLPIEGTAAIKRWIARALVQTVRTNRYVIDPTARPANPPSTALLINGSRIDFVTAEAIAADLATAEANITVTPIELSR